MKKVILLVIGLIPLLIGFIMNYMMMSFFKETAWSYNVIGLVFLAGWFLLGVFVCNIGDSKKQATLITHLPAFVVLILVLFQELIIGQYWLNIIGIGTQFFFLPITNLAGKFLFFIPVLHFWMVAIVAFLLMCIAFYLGCYVKEKRS